MTALASDSERLERLEGDDESLPGSAVGFDLELLPAGMIVPPEVDFLEAEDSDCGSFFPPGSDDCPVDDEGWLGVDVLEVDPAGLS